MKRQKVEIEIESGIPIPPKRKTGVFTNAFSKMKVGDSFTVSSPLQVRSAYEAARKLGIKSASRRTGDNEFRIWVVEKRKK